MAAWHDRTIHKAIGSFLVASPETIRATQIIPIDFCASFPPCPRLKAAADKSCNLLKCLSTVDGEWFLANKITMADIRKDMIIPNIGAININITILITPAIITESKPELAIAAPTSPPTRVCEDLEGIPYHQVIRFHVIAARIAAAITVRFMTSGFITPLPIVAATLRGNIRNATKLKKAAIITAAKGERTFVDTTVAIELAESWKPFIKSKIKTSPIRMYKYIIVKYLRVSLESGREYYC
jgi:hypothetical protein